MSASNQSGTSIAIGTWMSTRPASPGVTLDPPGFREKFPSPVNAESAKFFSGSVTTEAGNGFVWQSDVSTETDCCLRILPISPSGSLITADSTNVVWCARVKAWLPVGATSFPFSVMTISNSLSAGTVTSQSAVAVPKIGTLIGTTPNLFTLTFSNASRSFSPRLGISCLASWNGQCGQMDQLEERHRGVPGRRTRIAAHG